MHGHRAATIRHHRIGAGQLVEVGLTAAEDGIEVRLQWRADPQPAGQLDHLPQTGPLRQPQGHHVLGEGEAIAHRGAAAGAAGAVAAAGHIGQWRAGDRICRCHAGVQGRQKGEQLEGRARLTQGLNPIEAGAGVIAPAHVGQDVAALGVERDQRPLGEPHRGCWALEETLQLLLRQGLHRRIDGAEHGVVAASVLAAQIQPEAGALQLTDHVVGEEGIAGEARLSASGGIDVQGPPLGVDQALIAQPALLMHQLQHQVAPLQAGTGIVGVAGAVAVGAGQQSHQESRLAHIEIAGRLAEIQLGRLLETLGAKPQIRAIEIELEDPVLAEAHLQLQRHPQFPQLAGEAEVAPHLGVDHARHLLGEAAAAAAAAQGRTQGAKQVEPTVPAEAGLLGGHQRLAQMQRVTPQRGQRRGGALPGIDLPAAGREDLHRAGHGADLRATADGGRREHAAHQQGRPQQGREAQQMPRLLEGAARMLVAQLRRLTLQR